MYEGWISDEILCYDCVGALEVPSRGPSQGSELQNDGI